MSPMSSPRGRLLQLALVSVAILLLLPLFASLRQYAFWQERAAKRLLERGCELSVSDERPPQSILSSIAFGSDRLDWVSLVRFSGTRLSEHDIRYIRHFPRLSTIVIDSCPHVNAILGEGCRLPSIKNIYIYDCDQLNSNALRTVFEMSKVETLSIKHNAQRIDLSSAASAAQLTSLDAVTKV